MSPGTLYNLRFKLELIRQVVDPWAAVRFACQLHQHMHDRHSYSSVNIPSDYPGGHLRSVPFQAENTSCVSLLWGIFWTSECFNPQVDQDRSVGKLRHQEQSFTNGGCCCWRNTLLPGPSVGSCEIYST